jgi:hypothetical protein
MQILSTIVTLQAKAMILGVLAVKIIDTFSLLCLKQLLIKR